MIFVFFRNNVELFVRVTFTPIDLLSDIKIFQTGPGKTGFSCPIGPAWTKNVHIKTTGCLENFKINLDFYRKTQGFKFASRFSQVDTGWAKK